jgi:hypothetical protein
MLGLLRLIDAGKPGQGTEVPSRAFGLPFLFLQQVFPLLLENGPLRNRTINEPTSEKS